MGAEGMGERKVRKVQYSKGRGRKRERKKGGKKEGKREPTRGQKAKHAYPYILVYPHLSSPILERGSAIGAEHLEQSMVVMSY
jgi:hypothetical protein